MLVLHVYLESRKHGRFSKKWDIFKKTWEILKKTWEIFGKTWEIFGKEEESRCVGEREKRENQGMCGNG